MHPPLPDVTTTPPIQWKYISEGGASIVFSFTGPHHPQFSGTVLRLRKAPCNSPTPDVLECSRRTLPMESGAVDDEPDDPTIAFQNKVIARLVPPQHLPRLEAVRVSQAWLEELRNLHEDDRPIERRLKDQIDVHRAKAVLATDLVGGPVWAVEIKPKWGFLPNPQYLSSETTEKKSRRCRFCMHSHYKTSNGDTPTTEYCPLDLYSGDEQRTRKSLRALWDSWTRSDGAVNNLKIFVQGDSIRPSDNISLGKLADVLQNSGETVESCITALLPLVLESPLLRILSGLQRSLDQLDIEGLSALWQVANKGVPLGSTFADPPMAEWDAFTTEYLASTAPTLPADRLPDSKYLHYFCVAYLLSATFKDCSVIFCLGKGGGEQDSATVIDLDPKSMERLQKWADLDRKIVDAFDIDDGTCVDSLKADYDV